jgi:hypothetical protein
MKETAAKCQCDPHVEPARPTGDSLKQEIAYFVIQNGPADMTLHEAASITRVVYRQLSRE